MATLSITVPDAQVPRVLDAVTDLKGLPAQATADDVRQLLVDRLIEVVKNYEQVQAEKTAREGVTEIGATL